MTTRKDQPQLSGITQIKIKIPVALNEQMKELVLARKGLESSDVKRSRLWIEAGEQYVNAKAQQQLLKERANANDGDGKSSKHPGARATARV